PNQDTKALTSELEIVKKRLAKLEKIYGVFKKSQSTVSTASSSNVVADESTFEELSEQVKAAFEVDPKTIKAPLHRPTMIIRELYKKTGKDLKQWEQLIMPNQALLKKYIQQKCLIVDEDIGNIWAAVIKSMDQFQYDAVKYSRLSKTSPKSSTIIPSAKTTDPVTLPTPVALLVTQETLAETPREAPPE
ncbi:unnamed protein product, partial [Didymodactylos carnosus]